MSKGLFATGIFVFTLLLLLIYEGAMHMRHPALLLVLF
ncbi:hypothetical protein MGSAQ_000543 [marine sediment metagenome]|uniref:Uncharacterized protein n=1 Tax=marine sediment metagenome TaxID=412755 RepID=A0A1B6NX81_9ZZZZ